MTDRIYEAAVRWRELTRLVYASEAQVFAVIGVDTARGVP
ncbi:Uncharacterised protein [Rhodococcus rhodochrous]|nr:Uncharacterised protein [Rhodococcus rhodochrous]